ncbi:MAG TPA: cupredoxin domain-containing protein [Dehalococcoidia bacterium]|nr:cupredoxin domain-containing protein [Dehalococcoidia bacterium]
MNRLCLISLLVGVVLFGVVVACGGGSSKDSSSSSSPEATSTSVSAASTTSPATATSTTAPPAAAAATSTTAPPPAAVATNTTVPPPPAATSTTAPPPPTSTPAPPAGTTVTVTAVDFSFNPLTLTVKVGQPVFLTLINSGSASHSFTISGVADTGILGGGTAKQITFTPTSAGTLTFFCLIHGVGSGSMKGTLTVTP